MKRNIVALVSRRWQQGIAAVVLFSVPVLAIAWLCPGLILASSAGPATQDLTFDAPAATFASALATEAKAGIAHKDDAVFLAEHWAYTSVETEAAENSIGVPLQPGEVEDEGTPGTAGPFIGPGAKAAFLLFQHNDRKARFLQAKAERIAFRGANGRDTTILVWQLFLSREQAERGAFFALQKAQRAYFNFGIKTSFSHAN
jgi:hypothetical protein